MIDYLEQEFTYRDGIDVSEIMGVMKHATHRPSGPIPIVSCPTCKPTRWINQGESKGTYKCKQCRRIVRRKLKNRFYEKDIAIKQL